ncbi:hypothetical protein [Aureibaculum conchae]|uniref:hypothetical protein n=1 Tax=Aureibaculum sp. 2308TA14-22 TaxID=3108392 RepID=UPI00339271DB
MRNFKVEANELLQRSELKSVFGGRVDEGSCAYVTRNGDGEIYVEKNVSQDTAESFGEEPGNNWCCESCNTASWIDSCNVC